MKRSSLVLISVCFALLAGWAASYKPVTAASLSINGQADSPADSQADSPAVLCLPGIYLSAPGDCVATGPSGYLTRMAEKGIAFPIPPLSASLPAPTLKDVDVNYAEVITPNAPVYSSLDEAIAGNKKQAAQRLNGQIVYVSYTAMQETSGKKFYQIDQGAWIWGGDVSRIGVLPTFQGLLFSNTPVTDFGWVLTFFAPAPQVETKRTPGYQGGDYTGRLLNLYDVVRVFAEQSVDDELWYMIGPDEWVPKKYVARVKVNPTPPAGVPGERWIEVNLFEQTLAVYDRRQLIFATVIATGIDPFWTQPGVFQVYEKHDKTAMSGSFEADRSDAYYLEDVPWTMYYDQARALHGAYWRTKMGFEQSHGCINMTPGDAHWLFDWAQIGDWVYVWDPSGRTPTDPNLYGTGGF
ncbi:MAG: L,D-transpeptidase [Anaerolineales bacterium]|nr:L,D-transpeptidase [Anaerolineales bacterium]